MYIQKFASAAGSKIAVTSTAARLFDLINTAQSTTSEYAGFSANVNGLIIQPEDGDIRVLFDGNTPTATNGFLIRSGAVATLNNVPLSKLRLIRTGSSNVACSIQVGRSADSENTTISGAGSSDSSGNLKITNATLGGGENLSANRSMTSKPGNSARITTATTTVVTSGTCVIARVLIEAALTGTVTIYDNTAASGTIKAILPIGFPAGSHTLDFVCSLGCTAVTSAADRLEISTDPN